jgi:hypothetical protein
MRLQTVAIFLLTLAGFALRLYYLTTTHPFFDEYTTVLAARQILEHGWPVLPSGLFYEHGLLTTYLSAPFTALYIYTPIAQWQSAQWALMLSRWPSTLIGTFTIPLIYVIGHRINGQPTGDLRPWSMVNGQSSTSNLPTRFANLPSSAALLAAGLFALSPEGMVWGGRARMYALATLLVLLTVYWAYRGAIHPAPARYRWWAMLALLAALLTQFGVMTLVPPLLVAMVVVGWLSYKEARRRREADDAKRAKDQIPRIWFISPPVVLEILALAAVIGLAVFVKRLGQPLGAAPLSSEASGALPDELLGTVTYQTAFHFTWADTVDFLAEQFGPAHHLWLAITTVVAAIAGLIVGLVSQWQTKADNNAPHRLSVSPPHLFLWLILGLIILEMVVFLDPFRRNPRYLVMYLPLFYLVAAKTILDFGFRLRAIGGILDFGFHVSERSIALKRFISPTFIALALLLIFTIIGWDDLRIALATPEPAYEEAFEYLQANWQTGDALLTMNTPAASLYRRHADGFTVQNEADQFLLKSETGSPVDRWLGAPWVGTAADFNAALNASERVWFVIDTIRLPVFFRGDWQAIVNSQMEQVWAKDDALIFRTRPDRIPLPTQPTTLIKATLGDSIQLVGYTLPISTQSVHAKRPGNASKLYLTLFWHPLHPLTTDYTVFLHLRNAEGATVAQVDSLSLDGIYPTSRWQPGETVIDPFTLSLPADLPPGRYTLWTGMYRLETLERLPVANDTSGENAVLLGEVNFNDQ